MEPDDPAQEPIETCDKPRAAPWKTRAAALVSPTALALALLSFWQLLPHLPLLLPHFPVEVPRENVELLRSDRYVLTAFGVPRATSRRQKVEIALVLSHRQTLPTSSESTEPKPPEVISVTVSAFPETFPVSPRRLEFQESPRVFRLEVPKGRRLPPKVRLYFKLEAKSLTPEAQALRHLRARPLEIPLVQVRDHLAWILLLLIALLVLVRPTSHNPSPFSRRLRSRDVLRKESVPSIQSDADTIQHNRRGEPGTIQD